MDNRHKPSRCKWTQNSDPFTSPHIKRPWEKDCKILPNIMDAIGNTPLVKLNKLPRELGLKCDVYAKCEFMNPGCSIKDRSALRMVMDAEDLGFISPGTALVEASLGNLGIALSMVSAVKGYKAVIVLPEKTAKEKVSMIKALGGKVFLYAQHVKIHEDLGILGRTQAVLKETENSYHLNQAISAANPLCHYDQTCEEVLDALNYDLDMVVCACGTGATITGMGRKLKEMNPEIKIIGVDPDYSELARPNYLNVSCVRETELEGLGASRIIPRILDYSVIDRWIKVSDKDTFVMARRLMREEGLFCGPTGGAALWALAHVGKDLEEGKKVVIVLPDAVRYYLSRYGKDSWMQIRHYELCPNPKQRWWWDIPLSELKLSEPMRLKPSMSCHRALHELYKSELAYLPVVNDDGHLIGVLPKTKLCLKLIYQAVFPDDPIEKAIVVSDIPQILYTDTLGIASKALELDDYCIIYKTDYTRTKGKAVDLPLGLITAFDLVNYIGSHPNVIKYGIL